MRDPFFVAGTAVGITSLGIQTCQILHKYCSEYRGHHDDIDPIVKQAEGLQGILDGLQQVKENCEINNHAPSSQLHLALQACQETLQKLNKMAERCRGQKHPEDIQERLRAARKRALWPFRKDALAGMQTTLSRFQDNISLALQITSLDLSLRRIDKLQPVVDAIHCQTSSIEQH
ncbi:hypothetical protein EK21DRAFT_91170 [Setomelanomma holmii]|uniref:Azaphilone pigments biosynthesis cluster protein L N-terminal domain-containing protein n=1 Tax=Setomelanomma holmii TaxID=210430 RepID=A0A9P4H645_9PLEO|nr:hypothetical protein EK21DRAFT_91170 [Setomelanomma holmii]